MFIRFTRAVLLTIWNYSDEEGSSTQLRLFCLGEEFLVGEVSESGDSTYLDLVDVGVVLAPNDSWALEDKLRFWFCPDSPSKN